MGVDTRIYLPNDVNVSDVANVIGILAGLKPHKSFLDHRGKSWATHVKGVEVKPSPVPELAQIIIRAPKGESLIDGEASYYVGYHFEASRSFAGKYGRLLMPRSTPFWIAVGLKLAKFFGGKVVYRDCDAPCKAYGTWANRFFPKPRRNNSPEDSKVWQDFQKAIFRIKPLTKTDLKRAERVASYKDSDYNR